MKDSVIRIGVEIGLMMVCTVLGVSIWGNLIGALRPFVNLGNPYLWSMALMLLINLGHYLWGFFHTDADISDIPTQGMMTNYYDYLRIGIRILAFLTIGPSTYLRRAIEISNEDAEEDG